jgi:hypothetical protein
LGAAPRYTGADHVDPADVRASPAKSAAAQKPEAMHDTELSPLPPPSMVTGVAHDVPFQVRAWPLRSAAVHTVDDVHDTE